MSQPSGEPLHVVVITGLSGAGKTTASDTLEDTGFFCVDNLPVSLIAPLVEFSLAAGGQQRQLGMVAMVRDAAEVGALKQAVTQLSVKGHRVDLVFVDAADELLVRRYSETRRRHPLDLGELGLTAAIERERSLLAPLSDAATHRIDTSELSASELREQVAARFPIGVMPQLVVRVQSFGFKHGIPRDANLLLDVRFLPNPYFVEGLRERTGRDAPVSDFVLQQEEAQRFLERLEAALAELLPAYAENSGASFLKIAIGCTGGHHRSVALSIELARRLTASGIPAHARHRDIAR